MQVDQERAVREDAMRWLDRRDRTRVDYAWLAGYEYGGVRIPLMDAQRGIRKPAGMSAALAIRTRFTPPGQTPPYADAIGDDGLQRYMYRGDDPDHPENVALRRAGELGLPLMWFVGVAPAQYEPIYPVWVVHDDPARLEFSLALDQSQRYLDTSRFDDDMRRYAVRLTKARLHQRVFRAQVLLAYDGKCCICRLKHSELLDAAHIIADGEANGQAVVPNGLSMCKLHHSAFDHRILGVRPDLTLHVRDDVLGEVDGWMLEGGIQRVHNRRLEVVPTVRAARPDRTRLEERYDQFLAG